MKLTPVDSAHAAAHGYDPQEKRLTVQFKNGQTYSYSGVPEATYKALCAAPSFGTFLHRHVKPHHVARRH